MQCDFGRGMSGQAARRALGHAVLDALEGRQLLSTTYALDFEDQAEATIINNQYASKGVLIHAGATDAPFAQLDPSVHPAMIFDSANPTGDDDDLGTPNQSFKISQVPEVYGPGKGTGGQFGSPGANALPLGHVLIVEQDNVMDNPVGEVDGPNDWDKGGALVLTFPVPVTVHDLDVIDIDTNEGYNPFGGPNPAAISTVEAYDADGNLITAVPLAGYGDNSYQRVTIEKSGVAKLVIAFRGIDASSGLISASGAIDNVRYTVPTPEPAALGDTVWEDLDKDGTQDAGEPGVGGVEVKLYECGTDVYTGKSATTDASGKYLFSNLAPGSYYVKFTLPSGFTFTTANVGANDAIDSDADVITGKSACTDLSAGEIDLTLDAGLVRTPTGFRGLTPGFWKQSQHFYAWKGYTQNQSFESVFGVNVPGVGASYSLLSALNDGGGGYHALNRHAAAALLNASNPAVNYKYTAAQVIAMVQQAYATGNYEATKDLLAAQNELGGSIPKP